MNKNLLFNAFVTTDNIYDHQNAKILTITTYNNIEIFKKFKSNRDLELKQELVKKIRSRLYECSHLFVVLLYNERTDKLQTVRAHFSPSESSYFFFGKNHGMQFALGRTPPTEYYQHYQKYHLISLEKWVYC
ncbi:unnamed protein product [Rotaria magnacalcarata]|uniref:Uncharacterized protein n=2 Tax=Rotaria magnacalcarata TaxID=392030 RepID=A0A8S2YE74_9BILA|nr:unnamed protein product [Rotaria magnacalcarata]